jgi:hypothetical protein
MDLSVGLAVDLFEPNIDNAKPCQDVVSMRQFPPNTICCSLRLDGLTPSLEVIASDSFLDRSFLDSSLSSEGLALLPENHLVNVEFLATHSHRSRETYSHRNPLVEVNTDKSPV